MSSGDEEIPATIGPYRVESTIGRGGMGIVYRASGPDGVVAVKVLRGDSGRASELLQRFRQEALLRIDHPNVVRTLASGNDGGRPWIAFELLSGRSLAQRLAMDERPTLAEVLAIGRQAASGLAAAHAAGIVHRDLKPGNLFVCDDGTVKILDFGIARVVERDTRLTASGSVVGTAAYLSPEQARGDEMDARSDVWSLGVVMYEAIAMKSPFDRGSLMASMLAILAEDPPPLTALRRDVPPALSQIVARCLERPLEKRFANGAALLEAIDHIVLPNEPPSSFDATVASAPLPASALPPGEQRVVAVMLAEAVQDMRAVGDAIESAGGVLVPLGDRALGVFGSTHWEGDEMERAARAAIRARPVARAVAVASGRARWSGTTGIAGSVLEAAEAGCRAQLAGVALDESTSRALRPHFEVRAREGGGELVEERERGSNESSTGRTMAPPHGLTIGREAELAQMRRALRRMQEENCAVALSVIAPPGGGKSHLRWEMARILESEASERPRVLAARAEPLHRHVAFFLFRELLRARALSGHEREGWPSLDASASVDERRGAIIALAREVDVDAAFLGELLGIEMGVSGELTAARRDPVLMADRLRLTLNDWITALTDSRPLALLLDDLQWADDASLELLEELTRALSDAPLFVFACARPELEHARPELFRSILAARIEPRALLPSEVEELAAVLAGRPLPPGVGRRLAERSGGNPLFVEQIVRTLEHEQRLDDASSSILPLPLTVEAAVQSRLDHLPTAEKELCKRAALIERAATPDELEVLGVFEPRVLLASLVRRDVLAARGRTRGISRYRFKSQLVRDVAYGMLGAALREELHARMATHLAAREDSDAEEVASHFERAARPSSAAPWYRKAALAASRRGDPPAALACAERALALGAVEEARCELHRVRSEALEVLGRIDEQGAELEEAAAVARTDVERARVAIDRAVVFWRTGRPETALKLARAAVSSARAADRETLALALGRFAMIRTYAGALDEAESALAEAEPLAREEGVLFCAHAASWRAQLANARGDQGERRRAYREAVRLYEQAGDVRRAAGAELNLADAANRVGAYAEADRALRAAAEKAERVGNALWEGYAYLNLGYAATMLGRLDEARTALARAASLAERTGEERLAIFARVYEARTHVRHAPERAAELALRAAEEAGAHQLSALRVLAFSVAAAAQLGAGRIDEALTCSRDALALRDELGAVEEDEAEVFLVRARALEAAGEFVEGQRIRERGRARLRELAERIADTELRVRFLEDVPAHRDLTT